MAITASEARTRFFPLIEQVNTGHPPVEIKSRHGDSYLISAVQYKELLETIEDLRRGAAGSPMESRLLESYADATRDSPGDAQIPTNEGVVPDVFIETDERRRITLGKLGWHRRYLGRSEPDGTIVLTPAVVMSESQARLLARPGVMKIVDEFLADPQGEGISRPRPKRRRSSDG